MFAQQWLADSMRRLYLNSTDEEDRILHLSKMAFYTAAGNPDSAVIIGEEALSRAKKNKVCARRCQQHEQHRMGLF